jgi:hypothetical protein
MAAQVGTNKTMLHNVVSMAYGPLARTGGATVRPVA